MEFFKNLKTSSASPVLAPEDPIEGIPAQTNAKGVTRISKNKKGSLADLPSMKSAKGRRSKVLSIKGK